MPVFWLALVLQLVFAQRLRLRWAALPRRSPTQDRTARGAGESQTLAAALLRLRADPSLRARLGQAAREAVFRGRTLDLQIWRTRQLYERTLSGKHRLPLQKRDAQDYTVWWCAARPAGRPLSRGLLLTTDLGSKPSCTTRNLKKRFQVVRACRETG